MIFFLLAGIFEKCDEFYYIDYKNEITIDTLFGAGHMLYQDDEGRLKEEYIFDCVPGFDYKVYPAGGQSVIPGGGFGKKGAFSQ